MSREYQATKPAPTPGRIKYVGLSIVHTMIFVAGALCCVGATMVGVLFAIERLVSCSGLILSGGYFLHGCIKERVAPFNVCISLLSFLLVATVLSAFGRLGYLLARQSSERLQDLVQSSPFRERIGLLPMQETLVRAAKQPTANPEEMLRPASAAEHSGAGEQLLRPGGLSEV